MIEKLLATLQVTGLCLDIFSILPLKAASTPLSVGLCAYTDERRIPGYLQGEMQRQLPDRRKSTGHDYVFVAPPQI